MATLFDIRQEIRAVLDKHHVMLVIRGEGGMDRNWIDIETQALHVNDIVGSTALY